MAQPAWSDPVLIATVAEFCHPAAETGRFAALSGANDGSSGVSILASSGPAPGRWPRPRRFNLCVFPPCSRLAHTGLSLPLPLRAAVASRHLHGLRLSPRRGGGMPDFLLWPATVLVPHRLSAGCCGDRRLLDELSPCHGAHNQSTQPRENGSPGANGTARARQPARSDT